MRNMGLFGVIPWGEAVEFPGKVLILVKGFQTNVPKGRIFKRGLKQITARRAASFHKGRFAVKTGTGEPTTEVTDELGKINHQGSGGYC